MAVWDGQFAVSTWALRAVLLLNAMLAEWVWKWARGRRRLMFCIPHYASSDTLWSVSRMKRVELTTASARLEFSPGVERWLPHRNDSLEMWEALLISRRALFFRFRDLQTRLLEKSDSDSYRVSHMFHIRTILVFAYIKDINFIRMSRGVVGTLRRDL